MFGCVICEKTFKTYRGLNQHIRSCIAKTNAKTTTLSAASQPISSNVNINTLSEVNIERLREIRNEEIRDDTLVLEIKNEFECEVENDAIREVNKWGTEGSRNITKYINDAYEKIVFWRKNILMLPTGSVGKNYVVETTRLLNAWTSNSPMKDIASKAIHIMPSLLFQKPSKTSKSKDHTKVLERRMTLWLKGEINELVFEAETIQNKLTTVNSPKDISQISKQFIAMMEKGNVNGALKVLTNNMSNGILSLNDEMLNLLKEKYSEAQPVSEEILLKGEKPEIHPVIFDVIDEEMIKKSGIKNKRLIRSIWYGCRWMEENPGLKQCLNC